MKRKCITQSGFFNRRVLVGLGFCLAGFFPAVTGLGQNEGPSAPIAHVTRSAVPFSAIPEEHPEPQVEANLAVLAPATRSTFIAKWDSVPGALGYRLDVSTNSSFSNYVSGYQDLNVGNVTGRVVTGLSRGTPYYYRVRAYNASSTSRDSNTMSTAMVPTTGLTINPTFDNSILNDPNTVAIQATINQAISIIEPLFSDPITVSILFRYSTTGDPSCSSPSPDFLGASCTSGYDKAWGDYTSKLIADATTANDATANASLSGSTLSTSVNVSSANGRAVGLNTPGTLFFNGGGPYDATITLNPTRSLLQFSRPPSGSRFDALAVIQHEMNEVLGLAANANGGGSSTLRPQDLFSWSSAGNRNLSTIGARYFSIDSGSTHIVDFNQGTGDKGDWVNDCGQFFVQNAIACQGQLPTSDVTATSPEGINLDIIGYNLITSTGGNETQDLFAPNGGFENGLTGWSMGGTSGSYGLSTQYPHSGTSYAVLCNNIDNAGSVLDHVYVTIPGSATSVRLNFWLNVVTQETTVGPYDRLVINVIDSSGVAHGVGLYSEADKGSNTNGDYVLKSLDLTAYKGQSVQVEFFGSTDGHLHTIFRIDDVSLLATTQTYTITTSSSPTTGGTTTGGGSFAAGSSRTVTATANSGYSFSNWTENGSVVSTSASYMFTLNSNRNLVANFSSVNYTITTSSSPAAGGTTTGGGSFPAGSSRTVSATANSGYSFSNWTENGSVVSTSASYTFTLNSNRNLVANFSSVNYTIATSSSPAAGGTTTGGGSFPTGSSRTVTATANSGYSFASWTESGSVVSSSASYTFTLNSNRNLVANFTTNPSYTVTTSSSPSSGGATSGGGSFASGTSVTVTAIANSGYTFSNWMENGGVVSSSASYTFTLSSNRSLVANFTTNPPPTTTSIPVADGAVLAIVADANGLYVTAEQGGAQPLIANRTAVGVWEQFQIQDLGNGFIALRALANGMYVTAENAGNSPLIANRTVVGVWEQFQPVAEPNGKFALIAKANGKYVCAESAGNGSLIANRTGVGGWEQFQFAFFSSIRPVNVTAAFQVGSANGKYVAAEGAGSNPLVANRDIEASWEQFRFVEAGGGTVGIQSLINNSYVAAENAGGSPLIANRPVIGTWEQFRLLDLGNGKIALQAAINGRFVSANNPGNQLIANSDYVGPTEQFVINLSFRAVNGLFVTAENAGQSSLIANRNVIGVWEQFQFVNDGEGYFSLIAKANGRYVCAESAGQSPLIANRTAIGGWEEFQWIVGGNGTVAIKARANGLFVTAESAGASPLIANRPVAQSWEQFR